MAAASATSEDARGDASQGVVVWLLSFVEVADSYPTYMNATLVSAEVYARDLVLSVKSSLRVKGKRRLERQVVDF